MGKDEYIMKRMLILIIAAMLLLGCAQAQTPTQMRIVNCEEWVSLRAEPDSNAQRFAQVPLDATVRGFYQSDGDFSQCEYQGQVGYILNRYLQSGEDGANVNRLDGSEPSFELKLSEGAVYAWRGYGDVSETLYLARFDETGELIWDYATETLGTTELESLSAFVNENGALPMVMVYNSYYGLVALNAQSGEESWTLRCAEISLGGGIKFNVGEDGSMYIGGYYGPDPVAISADGEVMYQCSSLHEDAQQGETKFYWMYEIEVLSEGGLIVHYENGDEPVKATFDTNGNMISWEAE